jgi:hypothetical protein
MVFSWHLSREAEENHSKHHSVQLVSRQISEPRTPEICSRGFNYVTATSSDTQ